MGTVAIRFECVAAGILFTAATSLATAAGAPDVLKPPSNEVLSLQSKATGVQIYVCKPGAADPQKYEWTFVAPEAELRDSGGKRIGKHYGGPTWEADDGSKVVGEVAARDDGPDANAIPWLLLRAKANSGSGVLAGTTSIQRLDTAGGKAPAGPCAAQQAGSEARVPYTAAYYFFRRQ